MVLGIAAAHELEPKNPRRPTERVVIPTERSDEESLILSAYGGGGPFLRFSQKWGFFRALQLQTGANNYAATSR